LRRRRAQAIDERETYITQRELAAFFTNAFPEIVSAEIVDGEVRCVVKGAPKKHEEIRGVMVDEYPKFLIVRRVNANREELVPQVR